MTEIEKLLKPISDEKPCGEDIWLAEGRSVLQQPLEAAWRNGEPVNWADMRDQSLDLLQRSRDIRTAIVFCLSLLQTEGLAGFADGVKLVRALLENFWGVVHPLAETPEDQIVVNVLDNFSAPLGSDTPYQFVKFLRETPLCRSSAGTAYSLGDIERAEAGKPAAEGEAAPVTPEQIAAVLRACPQETLRKNHQLASDIVSQLNEIEKFITGKSGANVNFDALNANLKGIMAVCEPYFDAQSDNTVPGQKPAMTATVGGPAGGIRSRADADAALAAVSDYFKRFEPSSPVPLLIDRTRRMLKMDFLESMRDMAPEALEKLNMLFGIKTPVNPEENPGS